jgi:hypothetical protein
MVNTVRPELLPLDPRIQRLPVDERGYPVPWFVQWVDEDGRGTDFGVGKPEFRIADSRKRPLAINQKLCWVCGEPLGRWLVFVIGPMCAVNRVSAEPPCHRGCAEFSARTCPFLARPHATRRENDLPADMVPADGCPILRNPGVTLLWVCRGYYVFKAGDGHLIKLGDPEEVVAYSRGRIATKDEITESIRTGFPTLLSAAYLEGPRSVAQLKNQLAGAAQLLQLDIAQISA